MRSPTGTALINMKNRDAIFNPTQNLVNALKTNSFSRIRSAIKMPCLDLNYRDPDNECRTPLLRVCALDISTNARRDLARLLLTKQVDVNAVDSHGMTALAIACRGGDAGMVRLLAEDVDADPNLADFDGNTPLMHACRSGKAETVTALISSFRRFGLRVDESNNEGVTPLMEAARSGNADICRALVQEGHADVNVRDNKSFSTAMDFAIASGRCSTPELLLLSPVAHRKLKARQQREAMGLKTLKDVIQDSNMNFPRSHWVKPSINTTSSRYESLPLPTEYLQQVNSMVFQVGKKMQRLTEDPEGELREEEELEEEKRLAPIRRRYSLPSARHCVYGNAANKRNPAFLRQTASGSPRLARGGRGKPDWLKLPPVPETTSLSRSPSPTDRKSLKNNNLTVSENSNSSSSSSSPSTSPTRKSPSGTKTQQKPSAVLPANCHVQARMVSHGPSIASSSHKRPTLRISHTWEGRPSTSIPSYLFR